MKYFIQILLSLWLITACTSPESVDASDPIPVNTHKLALDTYLKTNSQYLITETIAQQAQAPKKGQHQWQISAKTELKLQRRDGRQLDNNHYKSDSTWATIQNGVSTETHKMSYEYNGKSELGERKIYASDNAFIIYESPAWSNHQYTLFTRTSANAPWRSRYVEIPMIPFPGESRIDLLRISNSHIWLNDGGKVFRYPFSILKTVKEDNPFIIG